MPLWRYGKSRIDRVYSKIPCEHINFLPFDKQYKYCILQYFSLLATIPHHKKKSRDAEFEDFLVFGASENNILGTATDAVSV